MNPPRSQLTGNELKQTDERRIRQEDRGRGADECPRKQKQLRAKAHGKSTGEAGKRPRLLPLVNKLRPGPERSPRSYGRDHWRLDESKRGRRGQPPSTEAGDRCRDRKPPRRFLRSSGTFLVSQASRGNNMQWDFAGWQHQLLFCFRNKKLNRRKTEETEMENEVFLLLNFRV